MGSRTSAPVVFPFPLHTVFQALPSALAQVKMVVRHADPNQGYVFAGRGVSWASWGEDVTVYLRPAPDGRTAVTITLNLKLRMWSTGMHDMRFESIFRALDWVLRSGYQPTPPPG